MSRLIGETTRYDRAEWGARAALRRVALSGTSGVTVHYEGPAMGDYDHSRCATLVRGVQAFHMDGRGWSDGAYSEVVCRHGYAYAMRGFGVRTAANGTNAGNGASYAICVLVGEGDTVPDVAKRAARDLIDWYRQQGSGGNLWPHQHWKPTSCCGAVLVAWVAAGAPRPAGPGPAPGQPPGPPPAPPGTPAPPFPLPDGSYFGPKSGPRESVSGYFSHRDDLRRWQAQMKARGWRKVPGTGGRKDFADDGLYGDDTAAVARAFQAEKRLDVDGLIGPATWAAAWTAPVT
jgi:peptidoglycan hydrolase-like protein with peptidoglycan-binding domain